VFLTDQQQLFECGHTNTRNYLGISRTFGATRISWHLYL